MINTLHIEHSQFSKLGETRKYNLRLCLHYTHPDINVLDLDSFTFPDVDILVMNNTNQLSNDPT